MIQTLRKSLMAVLTSKLQLQGFFQRNVYSRRTCVVNPTLLTLIQPKMKALKISYHMPHCSKEYEKEKEMTILTEYHWELLTIMGHCLIK